nr:peptide chain release factor N(5)-glutamine methyltransferase [Brevibacterium daeguense]
MLRAAADRLRAAGVPAPNTDARLLLAHVWDCQLSDVALHALRGTRVPSGVSERFSRLVARRVRREPLQHITGHAPFRYLELAVGPGVFIPRPETELLVGCVLEWLRRTRVPSPRILDLCTGTGALALSLATEVEHSSVVGVERSRAALDYAERNLATLQPSIAAERSTCEFVSADVRDLPDLGVFDIVVSNPPYVPVASQPDIPEVTGYDPADALYGGGEDGMEMPSVVIGQAARLLRHGGFVVIEHAESQGEPVRQVMAASGFGGAVTHADYTGRDRFTSAELEAEDT